ncbi:MAG: sensor histidine kinase, partial [Sphingomonadales bacterium]|nr:sensor histidine kinase [Sphingomonadales bacterium]
RTVTDPAARAALDNTRQRIFAIARIHQRLYSSASISTVDVAPYLESLVAELSETWSAPGAARTIRLDADSLELATGQAVSLGIVVNELVTNACKYAYRTDQPGEIRVSLRHGGSAADEGGFCLVVEDDGQGMPPAAQPRGTGLGSRLVEAMAASLQCSVAQHDKFPGLRVMLDCRGMAGSISK